MQKASNFKDGDEIEVNEKYLIEIKYGAYDTPALCSRIINLDTYKYIDIIFWKVYLDDFLHK